MYYVHERFVQTHTHVHSHLDLRAHTYAYTSAYVHKTKHTHIYVYMYRFIYTVFPLQCKKRMLTPKPRILDVSHWSKNVDVLDTQVDTFFGRRNVYLGFNWNSACMDTCTYMSIWICTHIHTHIYIDTYTQTDIHTYINRPI